MTQRILLFVFILLIASFMVMSYLSPKLDPAPQDFPIQDGRMYAVMPCSAADVVSQPEHLFARFPSDA